MIYIDIIAPAKTKEYFNSSEDNKEKYAWTE